MPDDERIPESAPEAAGAPHPEPAEPPAPAGEPAALEAAAPPQEHAPDPQPEPGPAPPNPDVEAREEAVQPPEPKPPKPAKQEPPPPESNKRWYAVKVQSGREESIKEAIERRVKIEGLEEYYGQILIPVERVQEIKNGKRVVKERKKFPGYLMAEVEYNDRILYLFRETSGVGDFVGGSINRPPPPLPQKEIERMLGGPPGKEEGKTVPEVAPFEKGDRVQVKDGIFAGMEGEVKDVLEAKGQVRVELTIFGRPTSVELEYWQVEQL
jgi:transcription termination/antitermination protein NusG